LSDSGYVEKLEVSDSDLGGYGEDQALLDDRLVGHREALFDERLPVEVLEPPVFFDILDASF
jgi:hypothetical protein